MSLNHLLIDKELSIFTKNIDTTGAEITNATIDNLTVADLTVSIIEADQIFTKGYVGTTYHALDTSYSTYDLVPTPRFTGATLYFSNSEEAILPTPPPSPGMYEVQTVNLKSCVISRCGNVVSQKYSFLANYRADATPADLYTSGICTLYFIMVTQNPIDSRTYAVRFSGKSNQSNGYDIIHRNETITTKVEAGNTYGELFIGWDTTTAGKVRPGANETYVCDFEVSWIENPILPPVP